MPKYVISGYIGFDNFGDEAICGVLTKYLKDNGLKDITVISLNPEKTSRLYGVKSCKMLGFLKPVLKSDILISGGGSLLQDITSLKSLLYYLAVIITALIFNKKVIIFAQGFTPFRTKTGEFLTKFVLKKCHKITVRDEVSKNLLEEMGIASELLSDPVLSLEIPKVSRHTGLGIQLRNCRAITDEFLYYLANEISTKFKHEEIKLLSLQDKIDLPVLEHFASILTAKGIIARIYMNMSVAEAIHEISELEYLIGMRFHSNLVAAKSGVKILGINYDIKVKTLSENIGFPSVGMFGCEVGKGIDSLLKVNPQNYALPQFTFPNLIV